MSRPMYSCSEPITEPDVLASIEQLPTEDDLPCDDGEPMETPRHRDQMNLLIDSLKAHWSDRTGYFVGGNMFLHYDPENRRRTRGPDFFLVLNVEDRERRSWVVWREGMRFPDVIIELLSDSTRSEDEGPKKALYAELFRTPEYYLYDPYSQAFTGYQLRGSHYVEMERDGEGRMYRGDGALFGGAGCVASLGHLRRRGGGIALGAGGAGASAGGAGASAGGTGASTSGTSRSHARGLSPPVWKFRVACGGADQWRDEHFGLDNDQQD